MKEKEPLNRTRGQYSNFQPLFFYLVLKVKEKGTLMQEGQEGTPWDRLNKTATLASSRREVFHYDPQVQLLFTFTLTVLHKYLTS